MPRAGVLDLVVGKQNGKLNYYENVGSRKEPDFKKRKGSASPFEGIAVGDYSAPFLVDLDADGARPRRERPRRRQLARARSPA